MNMRSTISSAIMVLAFAVFVIGCRTLSIPAPSGPIAHKEKEPDLIHKFTGSSFTLEAGTDSRFSRTIHHFVATEGPGMADIDMVLVFKTHRKNASPNPRCNERFPYGGEVVRMEWVLTYTNGAAFSGAFATKIPDEELDQTKREPVTPAVVCTDGVRFQLTAEGRILGGTGAAFGKVTGGRWSVEAIIAREITTGKLEVNLQYGKRPSS